jgi:hypothetical protein
MMTAAPIVCGSCGKEIDPHGGLMSINGLRGSYHVGCVLVNEAALAPKPRFTEYGGMSYEQASREAERLITTKGWFQSWERLEALRTIMQRHALQAVPE